MKILITYVNGEQINVTSVDEWELVKGEGVDYIDISNPLTCHIANASIYWVYKEDGVLVAGWGSIRYDSNPLTEILFYENGRQEERKIDYMPDLRLSQVKLGHWWPGKEKPVINDE